LKVIKSSENQIQDEEKPKRKLDQRKRPSKLCEEPISEQLIRREKEMAPCTQP
jgi:hypothetical protein